MTIVNPQTAQDERASLSSPNLHREEIVDDLSMVNLTQKQIQSGPNHFVLIMKLSARFTIEAIQLEELSWLLLRQRSTNSLILSKLGYSYQTCHLYSLMMMLLIHKEDSKIII
jgi:hypothetical protein